MRTAEPIATQTVRAATKATENNIKKLKIYLSNESKDRCNSK